MHRKVIHAFFSAIFAGPQIVEIQEYCYHGNVTSPLWRSRRVVSAEVDDTLREAVLFMPIKRLILGKGDFFHLGLSEFDNHPIISQMLNFCDVTPLFSVVLKKVSGETSDIHFKWRVKR